MVPRARMTRYAGSFVPSAISVFNQKIGRTEKGKLINECVGVYGCF